MNVVIKILAINDIYLLLYHKILGEMLGTSRPNTIWHYKKSKNDAIMQ